MHTPIRFAIAAFGLVIAFGVGLAGSAHGTTLADLNGGQSLNVGNLTFNNFTITVTGALDNNLAHYTVLTGADGFQVMGTISVSGVQQGDILMQYQVGSSPGPSVDSVSLAFDGAATGVGAEASVSENLFAIPSGSPIASASVFQTGTGLSQLVDSVGFAPQTGFDVTTDIAVKAAGPATISFVNQNFAVVPEPATGLLVMAGVLGLAVARRRAGVSA